MSRDRITITFIALFLLMYWPLGAQTSVHLDTLAELSATGTAFHVSGDWNNRGDFNAENSELVFSGGGDQNVFQPATAPISRIRVAKTGGSLMLTDTLMVDDSLLLESGDVLCTASSPLWLLSAAGFAGGSKRSLVRGPMVRTYPISGEPMENAFPIGASGDYRPLALEADQVAGDSMVVTAEMIREDPHPFAEMYIEIDKVSNVRYWQVSKTGGAFSSATVTLAYDTVGTGDGVEVAEEVRVAQLDETSTPVWRNAGGSGTADLAGTVTSIPFTGLLSGIFTLGDNSGGAELSLPVVLMDASLVTSREQVEIAWETASEVDNSHWLIRRRDNNVEAWATVGSVAGSGTIATGSVYSYYDDNVEAGTTYEYRLTDVSFDGRMYDHDLGEVTVGLPANYALHPNYPNPFNPSTTIMYDLPEGADIRLDVYNVLGQRVATLIDGYKKAGYHEFEWQGMDKNGQRVASGMYFYRLQAAKFSKVRKMMVIK